MNYPSLSARCLLFSLFSIISTVGYGQKIEIKANAYGGVFFFRGNASVLTSNVTNDDWGYYNPSPYGKRSSFSFTLELQAQRVTKKNHLFGAGVSFENLKTRAGIDSIWTDFGLRPYTGKIILSNKFVTINPYIGQRFIIKEIILDVQTGVDFAFSTKVQEEATITSDNNRTFTVANAEHPDDLRPRIQVNAYYKKVGLSAGYSSGLKNLYHYNGNPTNLNKKAYTNFLRLGISYRIK